MPHNPYEPPDDSDSVAKSQDQSDWAGKMIIYANVAILLLMLTVVVMGVLRLGFLG